MLRWLVARRRPVVQSEIYGKAICAIVEKEREK
jgi:hypothetical protein